MYRAKRFKGSFRRNVSRFGIRSGRTSMVPRSVPRMSSSLSTFRVRNREMLDSLTVPPMSSASWTSSVFQVNPGLATTFPWLSVIANSFCKYKFHGLSFFFKSTSANAISGDNPAFGKVVMVANYDPLASKYTNAVSMENSMWACVGKPSESIQMPVSLARSKPYLFVREADPVYNYRDIAGGTSVNNLVVYPDLRMYDHCWVQIAATGFHNTTTCIAGEVWVSYDVSFFEPWTGGNENSAVSHFASWDCKLPEAPMGIVIRTCSDSLGCSIDNSTLTTPKIILPFLVDRQYLVMLRWVATADITTAPSYSLTGLTASGTTDNGLALSTINTFTNAVNGDPTNTLTMSFLVTSDADLDTAPVITYTTWGTPPTLVHFEAIIFEVPKLF